MLLLGPHSVHLETHTKPGTALLEKHETCEMMVHTFITTHLDYSNALLYGLIRNKSRNSKESRTLQPCLLQIAGNMIILPQCFLNSTAIYGAFSSENQLALVVLSYVFYSFFSAFEYCRKRAI